MAVEARRVALKRHDPETIVTGMLEAICRNHQKYMRGGDKLMSSPFVRRAFHLLDSARLHGRLAWGRYYKFFAWCRGVEFLGACEFMGRPKFKLYPGTRVIVGNGCRFLSGHTDNLIGINRPCIISVYNRGTVVEIGEGCGFSGTVIGAFAGGQTYRPQRVKCGVNTLITDMATGTRKIRGAVSRVRSLSVIMSGWGWAPWC